MPQPFPAGSMGRKAKIAPAAAARLDRALAAATGSERNVREIYNALQEDERDQINDGQFKRLVHRRLGPAADCFEEHFLPGYEEEDISIFLP